MAAGETGSGRTIAVIVAAGRGTRAGSGGPKQYRILAGKPILARTAKVFLDHAEIDGVRIIIHRDDHDLYDQAMASLFSHPHLMAPIVGGAERQDSVRLGLESLRDQPPDHVLIHDAARPFIDAATINRVIGALGDYPGAIAALPVFDTIKSAAPRNADDQPLIAATVPREGLWRAQTPQGFAYKEILTAHQNAAGRTLTDDAAVAEASGLAVALVAGSPDNMKITQAEDFGMAEILLRRQQKDT